MNPMKVVISALAVLLLAFVMIGFVLSGEWTAEATAELAAPPESVFPFLNELEAWEVWGGFGAVEDTLFGPPAGVGATRRWDDPQWGQGEWTITASDPPRSMAYEVRVEDGALATRGTIRLEAAAGDRTAVTWTEEGDFGWNPLLSWFALGMPRMQREEMEKSLAKLDSVLVAGGR